MDDALMQQMEWVIQEESVGTAHHGKTVYEKSRVALVILPFRLLLFACAALLALLAFFLHARSLNRSIAYSPPTFVAKKHTLMFVNPMPQFPTVSADMAIVQLMSTVWEKRVHGGLASLENKALLDHREA